MKFFAIVGSGRVGGNTDRLTDAFLKGAAERGHQIAKLHLGETEVRPCLGCNACAQDGVCIQADGMERLLPAFLDCDVVVLATPVYFYTMCAQMKALIDELKPEFDYILLDCPAGIEQGFKNAIAGADRALVVTTPEVSAIRDADRIVGLLEANEMTRIDLIINRIRMDMVKRGDMLKVEDVCDILSIPLLGVIPDDEQVVVSTNQGDPLVGGSSLAGQAYVNICHRLMGEDVPMMDLDAKKGVMGILRELFRRS